MIHAPYATTDFAAMVCTVWFPGVAGGAVDWEAVGVADEDVFGVKGFYAWGWGYGAIEDCSVV